MWFCFVLDFWNPVFTLAISAVCECSRLLYLQDFCLAHFHEVYFFDKFIINVLNHSGKLFQLLFPWPYESVCLRTPLPSGYHIFELTKFLHFLFNPFMQLGCLVFGFCSVSAPRVCFGRGESGGIVLCCLVFMFLFWERQRQSWRLRSNRLKRVCCWYEDLFSCILLSRDVILALFTRRWCLSLQPIQFN